jgi:hypothetical protein
MGMDMALQLLLVLAVGALVAESMLAVVVAVLEPQLEEAVVEARDRLDYNLKALYHQGEELHHLEVMAEMEVVAAAAELS